jgi:hypothetical protein
MRPAKLAVQKAVKSRLSSALSVPVSTDPPIPGVEIGEDDESEAGRNTSSVHTDVEVTIRSYAHDETAAKKNGEAAVAALTDLSDLPALDPPFSAIDGRLSGHALTIQRDVQGPDIHTDLILITYRVTRS